jgi:hypothetical protein
MNPPDAAADGFVGAVFSEISARVTADPQRLSRVSGRGENQFLGNIIQTGIGGLATKNSRDHPTITASRMGQLPAS